MPFFTSFTGKILSVPGLKLGPQIFQFVKTLTSNTQEYNLNTDLLSAGWDGIMPVGVQLTIAAGIYVWSNSTSTPAITIGTFPLASDITLINNGYIMGKGGNGAASGNGSSGGPAINLNYPVSITNNSYIAGGGGGGASSGAVGGGGGAGGGTGGVATLDGGSTGAVGGSGGSVGSSGTSGVESRVVAFSPQTGSRNYQRGSGGGGGRILPGTGGLGGSTSADSGVDNSGAGGGSGGGSGGFYQEFSGLITSEAGQAGGSANNAGATGNNAGGGGGWGASGGGATSNGAAGGSGGKAVNLNGNTVTWLATGTRYGAIS